MNALSNGMRIEWLIFVLYCEFIEELHLAGLCSVKCLYLRVNYSHFINQGNISLRILRKITFG